MKYIIILLALLCLMLFKTTMVDAQGTTIEVVSEKGNISLDSLIKIYEGSVHKKQKIRIVNEPFDKFYNRADSLNKTSSLLQITSSLKKMIKEFNTKEPYHFLDEAQSQYEINPANSDEIAVLMYIGLMRFDYYVTINPSYKNNSNRGWMHYEDFIQQNYKTRIELYLANNIEKYKQVLNYSIDYCNTNDYAFCNKPKQILLHKKVMQQYENLQYDLVNNKESLAKKWEVQKLIKLTESNSNHQNENIDATENLWNTQLKQVKLYKEKEALWVKIEAERNNLNSPQLKEHIKSFIALNSKIEDAILESRKNSKPNIGNKTTSVLTPNDNSSSIYTSSKANKKLDTAKNQLDIYNYYDDYDKKNKVNALLAKVNANILDYVSKMNWDEEKKLSIFKLFYYHSKENKDSSLIIPTNYIKQADANTKPIEEFTGINIHIKKAKRKQAMVLYILGEVEGTLVYEDLNSMIRELNKEMVKNYEINN